MKNEKVICGVVALSLNAALLLTPMLANAGGPVAIPKSGPAAVQPYIAKAIIVGAAPYAMAAGACLRNCKDGWTYRDNVQASRKYFEDFYRNADQDLRRLRRR